MPVIDIAGKRFGRYTVLCRVENDKNGMARWKCRCDCGNERIVTGSSLRKGVTVSCGCYHRDKVSLMQTTHGKSNTRLFHIWQNMKARCNNPNKKYYKYYGGNGIKVCSEWEHNFEAFAEWANQNGYSEDLTIDRIDSSKGYEPSNCKWATRSEQQSHLQNCRIYEINGISHPINTWCKIYNMPHETVRKRINKGWDVEKALSTPSDKRYSHNKVTTSKCSLSLPD